MSDSDEKNYVFYGTPLDPLDEDNLPRKKSQSVQDQVATDEFGRRRFHGAFTGGFSAGYFNSVGTRDGWKPQQFKSTRKNRVDKVVQRAEDFMDEEDTSEFGIAPTGIRATADYVDASQRGTKRDRPRQLNDEPIPGNPVMQKFIEPVRERVGVRLLKQMGWKPGQGVGPRITKKEKARIEKKKDEKMKVYGCYMPSQRDKDETSESDASDDEYSDILFAPDDYEPYRTNPKDNYFGLGYSGLDKRPILSGHINLFEPQTLNLQEKNKKFSITGQAFGVGAFETEDDDIYARDDMSRYDFTLGPQKKTKSRWERDQPAKSSNSGCIEGFVPAKNPTDRRKIFKPPELPKDFKPFHVVRKSRFSPPIEIPPKIYGGQFLNAESRAAIMGESSGSEKPQPGSNENPAEMGTENSSTASKIIIRTLNLHGKEQVAERQRLEEERKKTAGASSSWMGKLYTSSFVKGGTVGSGLEMEGSLRNLNEFKEKTNEKLRIEPDNQTPETSGSNSGSSSNSVKPFIAYPDKQRRFEQYLVFLKNGEAQKLESIQPLSMTEWERSQESTEFEQAARLFESSLNSSEKKFVSSNTKTFPIFSEPEGVADQMREAAKKKMFGKLTRERTIWQPAKLVCKRFNVAEPRVGCAVETEKKKFSVFDSLDFTSDVSKFRTAANLGKDEVYESHESHREKREEEEMTEKEKNFEATYQKVFGQSSEEKKSKEVESSRMETSQDSEREANSRLEVEDKETVEEKLDLFKAIFLSSSEDSDPEPEERDDSEVVKSVLIGKTPSGINVLRNTSPPRGIFAKLDLDSLIAPVGPSDKNKKESEASVSKADSAEATLRVEPEVVCEEVLPPDVYGPLPPRGKKTGNSTKEEAPQMQKPFFKSVVVPKIGRGEDKVEGEWVERTKEKKSKKEKKKHKHKDKDKERSKHKKSKKGKR